MVRALSPLTLLFGIPSPELEGLRPGSGWGRSRGIEPGEGYMPSHGAVKGKRQVFAPCTTTWPMRDLAANGSAHELPGIGDALN
jgi:hypothetical protein